LQVPNQFDTRHPSILASSLFLLFSVSREGFIGADQELVDALHLLKSKIVHLIFSCCNLVLLLDVFSEKFSFLL
jgi:hypothetical protein